jgi:hypothetical protein
VADAPSSARGTQLLALQRTAGNAAVTRTLSASAESGPDAAAADYSASLMAVADDMALVLQSAEEIADPAVDDPDGHLDALRQAIGQVREAAAGGDAAEQQAVLAAFSGPTLLAHEEQLLAASPAEEPAARNGGSPTLQRFPSARTLARRATRAPRTSASRLPDGPLIQRQLAETLVFWGTATLATDAELAPVEAATGPPGWAVAAGLAVVGVALIGAGLLMASGELETLTAEEERALADKAAGRPFDKAVAARAERKLVKNEKVRKERNKQKRGG